MHRRTLKRYQTSAGLCSAAPAWRFPSPHDFQAPAVSVWWENNCRNHVHLKKCVHFKVTFSEVGDTARFKTPVSCCCCCCRPHSTNVLPAESSTRNHVAASSLSPQVARKGSTLSGFVQRSRLEREVGRDLHSNKWEEV